MYQCVIAIWNFLYIVMGDYGHVARLYLKTLLMIIKRATTLSFVSRVICKKKRFIHLFFFFSLSYNIWLLKDPRYKSWIPLRLADHGVQKSENRPTSPRISNRTEWGKGRLGSPSNSTLMNTNRRARKCLIMQSGLIRAHLPNPHRRTHTHTHTGMSDKSLPHHRHTKSQQTLTCNSLA